MNCSSPFIKHHIFLFFELDAQVWIHVFCSSQGQKYMKRSKFTSFSLLSVQSQAAGLGVKPSIRSNSLSQHDAPQGVGANRSPRVLVVFGGSHLPEGFQGTFRLSWSWVWGSFVVHIVLFFSSQCFWLSPWVLSHVLWLVCHPPVPCLLFLVLLPLPC